MDVMDLVGGNDEWDGLQDCFMTFFPPEQGCLLAPPPMPPMEPDTSSGSVGSTGHSASRPDASPPSSHGNPACIQLSAPGSPGFCPSLLPRAVEPGLGPGHELGVAAPEPDDIPLGILLPWDSLPLPPMPPPPMPPPPPKSESPPHWGASPQPPECCGPNPCIGLCTGVPPPALKQGGLQPFQQQQGAVQQIQQQQGGIPPFQQQQGGHLSEPLARTWGKQVHSGQRYANEAEDLFAPAKDGLSGQSDEELGMGSLSDTIPMAPMRQCKLSCSDLPSLASQQPAAGKLLQDRSVSQPPQFGPHPNQQQLQQFAQHKQQQQQQSMQQDPGRLSNYNANARRSSSFQQQQPQQQPVYTLYPGAFQRSISYGEAPMMPQPAQLPKSMGQPPKSSIGGLAHQSLQAPSLPEVVQKAPTEQVNPTQQQQPQQPATKNGRQTRATTGGARKKKGDILQQVQPTSASIKPKAGARGKQGKAPSTKPYRDKNRDNKFLIISMEQELQEKLALAAKLDSDNMRLRQRERIMSMGVASSEQTLQIKQNGVQLSDYLENLMQSFRNEVNVVTARRVINGMAKIADDRELNIDLFRDLWQALTSEISDALMKEGSVTGNLAATMAANARLSHVTAKVVDYFMAVFVRQQKVVQQAIGTNMFTGQEVSVDENFWASIARQLDITPEQMKDFVAVQGLCGACHHKNLEEREILKERLQRAMDGNQSEANRLMRSRKYVDTYQTATSLSRNLRRLDIMQLLASFITLKLLTPLQICKLTVLSMPVFPNLKALMMVIGSQCPAQAAEQAECPLKSDPLPLEEVVDKWGLGY